MTDSTNFSAIRARLRYKTLDEFVEGYGRFISPGGMFLPMAPQKLKPVGTTVRFQFLLADGSSAFLGEGVVRQLKGLESGDEGGPVGMLVKFTKLSPESKGLVERIVEQKQAVAPGELFEESTAEEEPAADVTRLGSAGEQEAGESDLFKPAAAPKARDALTVEAELDLEPEPEPEVSDEVAAAPSREGASFESSGDEIFDSALFTEADAPELRSDLDPEAEEVGAGEFDFAAPSEPDFFAPQDFGLRESSEPAPVEADDFGLRESSEPAPVEADDFGLRESSEPALFEEDEADLSESSEPDFFAPEDFGLSEPDQELALSAPEAGQDLLDDFLDDVAEPSSPAAQPAPVQEPKAIKETEAGIRVMAFDGEELDDRVTQEFEQFALGGGEEFDELLDNIFGGGDEEDLFGSGMGWGAEEEPISEEVEAAVSPKELSMPGAEEELAEEPAKDSAEALFVAEPQVLEEVVQEQESVQEEELAPVVKEESSAMEEPPQAVEPPPVSEPPVSEPPAAWETALGVDEHDKDDTEASEKILSLLEMDEESEPEMTLNLGAGLSEDSDQKDEEERSLESLFATTRKEIESKVEVEEEEDGWDILDELLGDSDLPPPAATASPFEVPVGGAEKRKRKGLMSRIFGKD